MDKKNPPPVIIGYNGFVSKAPTNKWRDRFYTFLSIFGYPTIEERNFSASLSNATSYIQRKGSVITVYEMEIISASIEHIKSVYPHLVNKYAQDVTKLENVIKKTAVFINISSDKDIFINDKDISKFIEEVEVKLASPKITCEEIHGFLEILTDVKLHMAKLLSPVIQERLISLEDALTIKQSDRLSTAMLYSVTPQPPIIMSFTTRIAISDTETDSVTIHIAGNTSMLGHYHGEKSLLEFMEIAQTKFNELLKDVRENPLPDNQSVHDLLLLFQLVAQLHERLNLVPKKLYSNSNDSNKELESLNNLFCSMSDLVGNLFQTGLSNNTDIQWFMKARTLIDENLNQIINQRDLSAFDYFCILKRLVGNDPADKKYNNSYLNQIINKFISKLDTHITCDTKFIELYLYLSMLSLILDGDGETSCANIDVNTIPQLDTNQVNNLVSRIESLLLPKLASMYHELEIVGDHGIYPDHQRILDKIFSTGGFWQEEPSGKGKTLDIGYPQTIFELRAGAKDINRRILCHQQSSKNDELIQDVKDKLLGNRFTSEQKHLFYWARSALAKLLLPCSANVLSSLYITGINGYIRKNKVLPRVIFQQVVQNEGGGFLELSAQEIKAVEDFFCNSEYYWV